MKAYIGLGSNVGNGKRTLQDAWKTVGEFEGVECLQLSSPCISPYSFKNSDYRSLHLDLSQGWFCDSFPDGAGNGNGDYPIQT